MMKYITVLVCAIIVLSGCESTSSKPKEPPVIHLTQTQAEDALKSIERLDSGDYRCRVEFEKVVWYITVRKSAINEFKAELKENKMTNIRDAGTSAGSQSESGDIGFGANGPGVSTGNGYQMDLKDGRISPSW